MEEMRQTGDPSEEFAPVRRESKEVHHDFSRFLDDFRTGREPQTTQWIRLASLVASQSFSCDIVIRAPRPKEKNISGKTPLDKLGESLARKIGAKYSPGRLKRDTSSPQTLIFDPENPTRGDRFVFDATSLRPDVRVLVVGDLETPEETYTEIVRAIKAVSPTATVKSFSLQWLEEHFRSTPFDDKYFLTSASPLSVLSHGSSPDPPEEKAREKTRAMPAAVAPEPAATVMLPPGIQVAEYGAEISARGPSIAPGPVTPVPSATVPVTTVPVTTVRVTTIPVTPVPVTPVTGVPGSLVAGPATSVHHKPAVGGLQSPKTGGRRSAPAPAPRGPATTPAWTAIGLIAILVVGVGVVVFARVFSPPQDSSLTERFIPESSLNNRDVPASISAVAPAAVVAERERGPRGIITVPSSGLRSGPSLDSRPVDGSVKGNERVTILKRRVSSTGPDWVQIETKSGKVGWVWASVVRGISR